MQVFTLNFLLPSGRIEGSRTLRCADADEVLAILRPLLREQSPCSVVEVWRGDQLLLRAEKPLTPDEPALGGRAAPIC